MSKFSVYGAATTFASGDLIVLDQVAGPTTKKMTAANLAAAALAISTGPLLAVSNVLTFGPNAATNPALKVDGSTASGITGISIVNAASGSGVAIAALGGTNEPVTIDAKGSGTLTLGATSTGNVILGTSGHTLTLNNSSGAVTLAAGGLTLTTGGVTLTSGNLLLTSGTLTMTGNASITGTTTVTSASATALTVGRQGATSPGLTVDASTSTCVTGVKITPAAAAAGVALVVTSTGTDEAISFNAKGAGAITIGATSTGNIVLGTTGHTLTLNNSTGAVTLAAGGLTLTTGSVAVTAGSILSASATAGVGYSTGAGGVVTQATSRATGVTLNTVTGAITLVSAAGSATPFSFTLTNSTIAATDTIVLSQKSGTDKYTTQVVTAVAAGSCQITLANASGTTTEQPVFNFTVIKGVAS